MHLFQISADPHITDVTRALKQTCKAGIVSRVPTIMNSSDIHLRNITAWNKLSFLNYLAVAELSCLYVCAKG